MSDDLILLRWHDVVKGLELAEDDRGKLVRIVKETRIGACVNGRKLDFDADWQAKAIAAQQELHLNTVYDRRKHCLAKSFASLANKHCRGVPPKLTQAHRFSYAYGRHRSADSAAVVGEDKG